jgi:DNA-binding NarL/FixJ family response regulator
MTGANGNGNRNGLTPREGEVLKLLAEGKSSKQIARQLGVSFKTVACHRSHILGKFEVSNTVGLVRAAIRAGLVEP